MNHSLVWAGTLTFTSECSLAAPNQVSGFFLYLWQVWLSERSGYIIQPSATLKTQRTKLQIAFKWNDETGNPFKGKLPNWQTAEVLFWLPLAAHHLGCAKHQISMCDFVTTAYFIALHIHMFCGRLFQTNIERMWVRLPFQCPTDIYRIASK